MGNKKPLSEAQKAAQRRYDRTRRTKVSVLLVNNTDADIIAYLKTVPNKQGLIKKLLRDHMASQKTDL